MVLAFSQYKQSTYYKKEWQKIKDEQEARVFPKGYEKKNKEELGTSRKITLRDHYIGQTISFNWIGKQDPTDNELQEIFRQFRTDDSNLRFYMTFQSELVNNFRLLVAIGVALPTLLFVGVGLYRYLFPITQED
jgi:hypothetical protein